MRPAEQQSADLEGLFRDCGHDLGRYFVRRHGGTAAVADLVQESFLQLARRLRAGQTLRSPRAYLFGIARHVSLAFLRKQGSDPEPLDPAAEQAASAEPDARLEAARECMAALPTLQREILDLRFTHDLSYQDIALALGIPVGTVRSRLHHAVSLLRQRLEFEDGVGALGPLPGPPTKSTAHET
jgi:RNA polymerase sigma-70 factor (ECF subfamily)